MHPLRNRIANTSALFFALYMVSACVHGQPAITNVVSSQRPDGSGFVDIYYSLSNAEGQVSVDMRISLDGGETWELSPDPEHCSGDIGTIIMNGENKHIAWNGMAGLPDVCQVDMRFRIIATENTDLVTLMLPNNVPLELAKIPAGTFMMGRYPGETGSYNTEDPQHPVTIENDFYMGKYEITQEQWLAVMGFWPGASPYWYMGVGNDYPAYYLSFEDAQNFIAAVNAHVTETGQGPATLRLPSEAEWEYACRAGATTRFYFGDSADCTVEGCDDCSAGTLPGNRSDYMWYCGNNIPNGVKPVGGKLPNAFGLYDMAGNIHEWCEDDWHENYNDAPSNGSPWVDSPRSAYRVQRGGVWINVALFCRSAFRNNASWDDRTHGGVGFRVAR